MVFAHIFKKAGAVAALTVLLFLSVSCSNPADGSDATGGDIISGEADVWCGDRQPFLISPDAGFLVFWPQAVSAPDSETMTQNRRSAQNAPQFLDLKTGENLPVEFAPDVTQALEEGFQIGKGGICWEEDGSRAYFSAAMAHKSGQPPQRPQRRYFAADPVFSGDGTPKAFKLSITEDVPCRTGPPHLHELPVPPVTVLRVSDKKSQIVYDGGILAEHRPRGRTSRGISIPDPESGRQNYAVSGDGHFLFYSVYERDVTGFSAPSHSYVLRLKEAAGTSPYFLGLSVYQALWNPLQNTLYACMKDPHGKHGKSVIAVWEFE
ncbi:MAG: hypothetical protein EA357_02080 [Micavibrio sp.]|nr:MAG: hypothetical protein EA357_02080 [Micavibrio sp.]